MATQNIIDKFKNKINETKKREVVPINDELEPLELQNLPNDETDTDSTDTYIEDKESEKIGSIFVNDEVYKHIFFPQSDITIFELARILSFTQMLISDNIYDKIPADLKRHFTKFSDKI